MSLKSKKGIDLAKFPLDFIEFKILGNFLPICPYTTTKFYKWPRDSKTDPV
jgi:hypothetical protein